jgi:methyl-accepting chemotaxis protein
MRWRHVAVGKRLTVAFVALTALIVLSAGTGTWGLCRIQDGHRALDALQSIKDDVTVAQHQLEDEAGWQGLTVAEAAARGYAVATGPDGYNRRYGLETKDEIYAFLDGVGTSAMTPAERDGFTQLRKDWDEFFARDTQLMTWLGDDTRAGQARAINDINSDEPGTAGDAYNRILETTDGLASMVDNRMIAMRADLAATQRLVMIALGVIPAFTIAIGIALSVMTRRSVVRPLAKVMRTLGRLSQGDLTARAQMQREDEIGRLGGAIDAMAEFWHATVTRLAGDADSLASSADGLSAATAQIATSAEETSRQAGAVARTAASVATSSNVASAGNDEVNGGVLQISRVATETAGVAAEAVEAAEATNVTMAQLEASSEQIDGVVKVITMIAEQTNLLALNATIEAARAGESGKGFAVVAEEVKSLSLRTAKATESIGQTLQHIGSDTRGAAEAISQITATIRRISEDQAFIAGAVEEQTATIAEMGRNMTQAARGGDEIAEHMEGVAAAAAATTAGVGQARSAATELARMSGELRAIVSAFDY